MSSFLYFSRFLAWYWFRLDAQKTSKWLQIRKHIQKSLLTGKPCTRVRFHFRLPIVQSPWIVWTTCLEQLLASLEAGHDRYGLHCHDTCFFVFWLHDTLIFVTSAHICKNLMLCCRVSVFEVEAEICKIILVWKKIGRYFSSCNLEHTKHS